MPGNDTKKDYPLIDGKCYDCSKIKNSATCNKYGALTCEREYYLERDKNNTGSCKKCINDLEHCFECKSKDKCDVCNSEFFMVGKKGKCVCKGGEGQFFNKKLKGCDCDKHHYRTM